MNRQLPVVSMESRKELALRIVQRKNSNVTELLEMFDHVVLYKLKNRSWVKLGIHGSLYIVKMVSGEIFVIVFNREHFDDFSHILTPTKVDADFQFPFVYIQKKIFPDNIFGIWFHDTSQAKRFEGMFQKLVKEYCDETPKKKKLFIPSENSEEKESESSEDEESEGEDSDEESEGEDSSESEEEDSDESGEESNGDVHENPKFSEVMNSSTFMDTLLNFDFMDDIRGKKDFKKRLLKLLENESILHELYQVYLNKKKKKK